MVAETASTPNPSQKVPAKRGRKPLHRVSLVQRAKARTLYLVEQLTNREICDQTGIPQNQLRNIIHREKWSTAKRSVKASVLAEASARTKERVEELYDSVALQTEALTLGTFSEAARRLADTSDPAMPRDLQALSQAGKNFVHVARQARNMDADRRETANGSTIIFIGALERVGDSRREIRVNAQPALEADCKAIADSPVKQIPDAASQAKPENPAQ